MTLSHCCYRVNVDACQVVVGYGGSAPAAEIEEVEVRSVSVGKQAFWVIEVVASICDLQNRSE